MNAHEQKQPASVGAALECYFAQVRLARATELAQSSRYLEAEGVLVRNGQLPKDPRELDLLARIAARQGRFGEARLRWNAALQIEPGNEAFHECLDQLTGVRRVLRWLACKADTALVVVAWVTVAVAIWTLVFVFGME